MGSVKKAFSEHSLSLVQIGREKQGHYPPKCWVFGALSELFDICGLPYSPLKSLPFSRVEDQQLQTCVSKCTLRLCEWSSFGYEFMFFPKRHHPVQFFL